MCAQRALPDKDELLVTGQLRLEVEGLGVGVDGLLSGPAALPRRGS